MRVEWFQKNGTSSVMTAEWWLAIDPLTERGDLETVYVSGLDDDKGVIEIILQN